MSTALRPARISARKRNLRFTRLREPDAIDWVMAITSQIGRSKLDALVFQDEGNTIRPYLMYRLPEPKLYAHVTQTLIVTGRARSG